MTLMLILGAIAALYCLRLLFRSAKFALPVCAAIALGFALRDLGFGWLTILGSALIAGFAVLPLGRRLVGGTAPLPVKLCVILMFVGAAAFAGYQAGTALGILGGLEEGAEQGDDIDLRCVVRVVPGDQEVDPVALERTTALLDNVEQVRSH